MTSKLSPQTAPPTRTKAILYPSFFLSVTIAVLTIAAPLQADLAKAEPAEKFLDALRQRGWHDTALESLDQADQDPLVTPEFLQKLDYERAVTQAALARQAPSEKQRQALLAKAAAGLQRFAAEHPESPLQLRSLATAGNLLAGQAISASDQADRLPEAAIHQRKKLHETARSLLTQAKLPLQTLLEQCASKSAALPTGKTLRKNPQALATLKQLQAKQAEARFLLAKLDFEKARTYTPDSKSHQRSLQAAAKKFANIHQEYEDKLVGFYGRLYQGRCYQTAGDLEQALECYADLVDQPPIPNQDFRRLVARAYWRRAECHLANADANKAAKECKQWLDESRSSELNQPAWLAVTYQLANAYERQAASATRGEAKRLRTESKKLYREVAKLSNDFQNDAQAKITSSSESDDKPIVAKNFLEAFDAGKRALGQMNSAKFTARLAKQNNPDSVEALNQQAQSYQTAARQYFKRAIQLADDQTEPEALATAHYYLCWLYWEESRLDEAAVIGEFVARRYPDTKFAPLAAKLALAAYERMYNASKQAGLATDFESQHLTQIAELLVQRWPESPEAATAINLLMNIALRDNRLQQAEELLDRLPPATRAAAELRLGGTLWIRSLQASKNEQAGEAASTLRQKAGKLLTSGYQSLQAKANPTAAEATGVLYYAQWLLARGEAKEAIEVLENASLGPLTLVESESEQAMQPAFVQQTYQVALRAYVSVEPPQRDQAQAMMTALESALEGKGNQQQKLIRIYVGLGLQLQQQIKMLSADGQAEKARDVAAAFEDLLGRVTQRMDEAENWKVQSWVAQTNLQIGQGLLGDDAARYYQQAEKAYQALLDQADQDPSFAPSPLAILAAEKRLADCLQAQKKYPEAFQHYTSILKEKPNMLELQQAAATVLQHWGVEQKNAQKLEESIRGAMPQANKKNLIWGWLRLAAIADQAKRKAEKMADKPAQTRLIKKYTSLFFEARYHAAKARYEAAQLANGANRKKQLQTARQSLASMKRLYPNLGGPGWQPAYESLLKEIEQQQ